MQKFNDYQLRFDLEDFDEIVDDAAMRAVDPRDAQLISEAAKTALELHIEKMSGVDFDPFEDEIDQGRWIPDYLKLIEHGWPWRVAAYIAWAASPKRYRWPKTITELSTDVLGLTSPRAIYNWRSKWKSIDGIVAILQAAPLMEHRADVIEALIQVASDPDYKGHADRKLFLELTGDYISKSEVKAQLGKVRDLSELTDEELDQLIGDIDDFNGSGE